MNLKFLSIRRISYNLAWYISKTLNETHNQKFIYYYVLQGLIGELTKIIIILSISLLCGIFIEVAISMFVVASIRVFAGGFHSDTNIKCFVYTLCIFMLIYFSSTFFINSFPIYIILLLFLFSFYLIYKFAPKENYNKPIISNKYRKNLKIKALSLNLFWLLVSIVLLKVIPYPQISFIIAFSTFIEAISLTNWFSYIANKIENSCTKIFCTRI